jgi:O-antigen/teichoic acid export membrane protein
MDTEVTLGDLDLSTVKTRTVKGAVTLISRSFLIQPITLGGFFLLTLFLGKPEIGLFIAVNDLVSILGYFSDVGLAASLIQKKAQLSLDDLRTTFTIQQSLVATLIIITLIASPWLTNFYHITGSGLWLLYSLLFAFFLASLKTIPSVIAERKLHFDIIIAVEIVENLVFYTVAVILAWRGAGVLAYAAAVAARGVIGTALMYYLSPWPAGLAFSKSSFKTLMSFGLAFQANSLLAVIKDRFMNLILWRVIGAEGVGIIGWSQTWSQKPLRLIMDNITRVTFQSFARLQDHPAELRSAIEKTLFFVSSTTFPAVGGLAVLAPLLVSLIPKYSKWEPALFSLGLYCFNTAWAAVSTPLTNTLNALGKVKWNTYLMIMWTALAWVLTPALAHLYGYNGVAIATAIIAVSSLVPILVVRRLTGFSINKSTTKPLIATAIMMVVAWYLTKVLPANFYYFIVNVSVSVIVFVLVLFALVGPSLIADGKNILYAFVHKK